MHAGEIGFDLFGEQHMCYTEDPQFFPFLLPFQFSEYYMILSHVLVSLSLSQYLNPSLSPPLSLSVSLSVCDGV